MRNRLPIVPFVLITACFALWGFANDITNPMVKAFSKIFRMSVTDGSLVQVAFYGGYFAMAVPAAMFIRRYTFKAGVMLGLALYAAGAFLFFPAKEIGDYFPFLLAYFIMTCGLSFLETSCNPYILAMGPPQNAIRRLNLAQSFNPLGSLLGMYVAMNFIQNRLSPLDSEARKSLTDAQFEAVKNSDLATLIAPYLAIGIAITAILLVIRFIRMPRIYDTDDRPSARQSIKRLVSDRGYVTGVITQFFYVGVQIMCWTFIIQYGTRIFMEQGLDERSAEVLSQRYNIVAMTLFCCGRFISTWLMKYFRPALILMLFAVGGALLIVGTIFIDGIGGLYCLVGVSACMSLMFPTIYGLALSDLSTDDAKFGAAGLIMSILGGSVLPPLQAMIIDRGEAFGMPAVNASFILPLLCFVVIFVYGNLCLRNKPKTYAQ